MYREPAPLPPEEPEAEDPLAAGKRIRRVVRILYAVTAFVIALHILVPFLTRR